MEGPVPGRAVFQAEGINSKSNTLRKEEVGVVEEEKEVSCGWCGVSWGRWYEWVRDQIIKGPRGLRRGVS